MLRKKACTYYKNCGKTNGDSENIGIGIDSTHCKNIWLQMYTLVYISNPTTTQL